MEALVFVWHDKKLNKKAVRKMTEILPFCVARCLSSFGQQPEGAFQERDIDVVSITDTSPLNELEIVILADLNPPAKAALDTGRNMLAKAVKSIMPKRIRVSAYILCQPAKCQPTRG